MGGKAGSKDDFFLHHHKKTKPSRLIKKAMEAPAALQTPSLRQQLRESSLPPTVSAFISKEVILHLKPYLEGEITREIEDKNRPSLVDTIVEKLHVQNPEMKIDKKAVEAAVIKEYVQVAARAFNWFRLRSTPAPPNVYLPVNPRQLKEEELAIFRKCS